MWPIRQLTIADLGHEQPTFLLTSQLRRSPAKLIQRYAHRMLIGKDIEGGIDFFHVDALSSAVAMKVSAELQLTVRAHSLFRGRFVAEHGQGCWMAWGAPQRPWTVGWAGGRSPTSSA